MLTDIEIAQAANALPIGEIAHLAGIDPKFVEPYGHGKAKIDLDCSQFKKPSPHGQLDLF